MIITFKYFNSVKIPNYSESFRTIPNRFELNFDIFVHQKLKGYIVTFLSRKYYFNWLNHNIPWIFMVFYGILWIFPV